VHGILTSIKRLTSNCFQALNHRFLDWTKPAASSLISGTLTDLARKKSELVAENALLRQQLIILRRQVKRPVCTRADRMLLVLLARMVRTWKQALFIVQPETLLRWHRQGFKLYWKYTSRAASAKPKISAETVALIKEMASNNRRLPSRTYSWRITQAGHSRLQTHDPEVHETRARRKATRTEVEHLLTHAC
jgi:putative transposase